jgi:hypothetical protein
MCVCLTIVTFFRKIRRRLGTGTGLSCIGTELAWCLVKAMLPVKRQRLQLRVQKTQIWKVIVTMSMHHRQIQEA